MQSSCMAVYIALTAIVPAQLFTNIMSAGGHHSLVIFCATLLPPPPKNYNYIGKPFFYYPSLSRAVMDYPADCSVGYSSGFDR